MQSLIKLCAAILAYFPEEREKCAKQKLKILLIANVSEIRIRETQVNLLTRENLDQMSQVVIFADTYTSNTPINLTVNAWR